MTDNNHNSMDHAEEHALDEVTRAYIKELQEQLNVFTQSTQTAMKTALDLELRRHKLSGQWRISEDGEKLVRIHDAPMVQSATAQ